MQDKEQNFVSAVVYIHNGQTEIKAFLLKLSEELNKHFEHSEIICVNDASSDKSVETVRELKDQFGSTEVTLLNLSFYYGLEMAMNAGVDLAIGDFVYEFDNITVDYSFDEVYAIYLKALEGYDIVGASPNRKQKFSSRTFYKIYRKYSKRKEQFQTETFRILSRRAINRVSSITRSIPYRKAVYAESGLSQFKHTYESVNGSFGAKFDHAEQSYRRELAVDSLLLFTDAGYSISKMLLALMTIFFIITAIYSVVIRVIGAPVEGWTSTILFLSVAFLGVFAILTIVMKYLQLILHMVFIKKDYNFQSIEKFKNTRV